MNIEQLRRMTFGDLKRLAAKNGINPKFTTKSSIIKALRQLDVDDVELVTAQLQVIEVVKKTTAKEDTEEILVKSHASTDDDTCTERSLPQKLSKASSFSLEFADLAPTGSQMSHLEAAVEANRPEAVKFFLQTRTPRASTVMDRALSLHRIGRLKSLVVVHLLKSDSSLLPLVEESFNDEMRRQNDWTVMAGLLRAMLSLEDESLVDKEQILVSAAETQSLAAVKTVLQTYKWLNVDCQDMMLRPLLSAKNVDMAELLIEYGADPNSKFFVECVSKKSRTFLDLICRMFDCAIMSPRISALLMAVIRCSNEKIIHTFLSREFYQYFNEQVAAGRHIFEHTKWDVSQFLFSAACDGRVDMVEFFIGLGGDVELVSQRYYSRRHFIVGSPILVAAYLGKVDVVRYLMENGADHKRQTQCGWNILCCLSHFCQVYSQRNSINECLAMLVDLFDDFAHTDDQQDNVVWKHISGEKLSSYDDKLLPLRKKLVEPALLEFEFLPADVVFVIMCLLF